MTATTNSGDTVFVDVNLALNVKRDISLSTSPIAYADASLRGKIYGAKDNDFLMITKKIGSDLTILSVEIVDEALIGKVLF